VVVCRVAGRDEVAELVPDRRFSFRHVSGLLDRADRLRLGLVIEVASANAVAWQFSGRDPEARERTALKVIAPSFFALAGYVTVASVRSLTGALMPSAAPAGSSGPPARWPIPGRPCCAPTLSRVLLVGLLLNSLFGRSWADPIFALIIAGVVVRDGGEA
jgi:hypothetical protein